MRSFGFIDFHWFLNQSMTEIFFLHSNKCQWASVFRRFNMTYLRQLAWWTWASTRTRRPGRPRWSSSSPTMRRLDSFWGPDVGTRVICLPIAGEWWRLRGLRSVLQVQGSLRSVLFTFIPCYVVYIGHFSPPSCIMHQAKDLIKVRGRNYTATMTRPT